jgi:hypothetical protein
MTTPVAPPVAKKLGPGSLTIGTVVADMSCRLSKARVAWSKDKEDDTPVLCGQTIAGATLYTAELSGTVLSDLGDDGGIVEYTWAHKGEQQPFVFIPNDAAGMQVTGTLIVDPLDVGGDEVKKNMTSDFAWSIVGDPILGDVPPVATGATAGIPGTFSPTGAVPPADILALQAMAVVASPVTAWPIGSYVVLGDASHAHWTSAAWVAGDAP